MSNVYLQAVQVVVYLGEGPENSDLAIDFMRDCDDPTTGNRWRSHEYSHDLSSGLATDYDDSTSSRYRSKPLRYTKSLQLIQAINMFFRQP